MNRERRISDRSLIANDSPDVKPELRPHSAAFPTQSGWKGLTTREYFAAIALQGLLANPNVVGLTNGEVAQSSVEVADALIEALNK